MSVYSTVKRGACTIDQFNESRNAPVRYSTILHSEQVNSGVCELGQLQRVDTACQMYCYGWYCVTRSVSPKVPENPSGPIIDNFIVLPCVACGVACVKLLPGVERWNSVDDPRVIGPCHCEVWGVATSLDWFRLFFGRPILETSRRGASFQVTHKADREC